MAAFGLRVSPVDALKAILADYPGGQILSEGLQNADDAGAGRFSLMLDKRTRSDLQASQGATNPGKKPRAALLPHTQCASMVMFDDGGFQDQDWESLQNIYASVKADAPKDTGQFGMGSRSFFHYTDVLQILSGETYVVMDPTWIAFKDGGRMESTAGGDFYLDNPEECWPFVIPEFRSTMRTPLKGTLIRLPLRGPEAAEKSKLNPHPFKIETASKLFDAFIREVTDGRMLLFLKSVQRIDIYIWENDAPAPVLRASAMKRVPPGMVASLKQAKRIPDSIPDAASSSFESLYDYLIGLGKEEAAQLTNPICNQIVIETYGGDDKVVRSVSPGEGTRTHWCVGAQFSLDSSLLELMVPSNSVPSVSIALPMGQQGPDNDPRSLRQPATSRPNLAPGGGSGGGVAFCTLPVADVLHGMPGHLNASFKLSKNRRSLWLPREDLDGDHAVWAEWNRRVMATALPRLYAYMLAKLAGEVDEKRFYDLWPDMETVDPAWRIMLPALYRELCGLAVLPSCHPRVTSLGPQAPPLPILTQSPRSDASSPPMEAGCATGSFGDFLFGGGGVGGSNGAAQGSPSQEPPAHWRDPSSTGSGVAAGGGAGSPATPGHWKALPRLPSFTDSPGIEPQNSHLLTPGEAVVFSSESPALGFHRDALLDAYRELTSLPYEAAVVVDLPRHVQEALVHDWEAAAAETDRFEYRGTVVDDLMNEALQHGGGEGAVVPRVEPQETPPTSPGRASGMFAEGQPKLRVEDTEWFLRCCLVPYLEDTSRLCPAILALAEMIDRLCESYPAGLGPKARPWLQFPGRRCGFARDAFSPEDHLLGIQVAENNMPILPDSGQLIESRQSMMKVLHIWGLKKHLSWPDVLEEAQSIAAEEDLSRGRKLVVYVNSHHAAILEAEHQREVLKEYRNLFRLPPPTPNNTPSTTPVKPPTEAQRPARAPVQSAGLDSIAASVSEDRVSPRVQRPPERPPPFERRVMNPFAEQRGL